MLTEQKEIRSWLNHHNIRNFSINTNLVVNVSSDVDLSNQKLTHIPVQFGIINGSFDCSDNQLASLKGSPSRVHGNFFCDSNLLTHLEFCPKKVEGRFDCSFNKIQINTPLYLDCISFYHGCCELFEAISLFHYHYSEKLIIPSSGEKYYINMMGYAFLEDMEKLNIKLEKAHFENTLSETKEFSKKGKI